MRKTLGWLVLAAGVAGLSLYGRANNARTMEAEILAQAQTTATIKTLKHGHEISVSGRDISISGVADSQAEKDAASAALDAVRGRRVVRNDMIVLPTASPYVMSAVKGDAAIVADGAVSSEALRAEIAQGAVGASAANLVLTGGAPAGWSEAARKGLAALTRMDQGDMVLSDTTLTLTGQVQDPAGREAVLSEMTALPEGYELFENLKVLDDGTPPEFLLTYNAATGGMLSGKLPRDMDGKMVAEKLGVPVVIDTKANYSLGIDTDPEVLEQMGRLQHWLPSVETLTMQRSAEGKTHLEVQVPPSLNEDLARDGLQDALGKGVDLSVMTAHLPDDGAERVNSATGQKEILRGAYWIPVSDFQADAASCATKASQTLAANRINFLSGSANLDARSTRSISVLAAVLSRCVADAKLNVEIGGHTDATGDAVLNQQLSEARAQSVLRELAARGLSRTAMTAKGYGSTQPIADNATEEGRAKNRRTTVVFSAQ